MKHPPPRDGKKTGPRHSEWRGPFFFGAHHTPEERAGAARLPNTVSFGRHQLAISAMEKRRG